MASLASVLAWGSHTFRARARARGSPRGEIGRTARWGARSTRIAAFGLLSRLPPHCVQRPVFVFGLAGRHFVFFSFFVLSWAFGSFCPAPIVETWGIGAPGNGTGRSKASCVFDENKCSHQCRVHVRGERGSQGNLCDAAARRRHCHCHMEKEK